MSNRLALEDSPYLQQHKENPVDWYPWCDEAFERAKTENKAIFISIGYSSCHWCHVMEHDVFESEEIAAFLNEHFISIKVDREERPDIDKHYQEVHMLLNRRPGGWPTSIFCTPQNKPFYAGTYIPPVSRDRMMGFSELTQIIAQKVAENDEKLFQNADEIEGYLQPKAHPTEATRLERSIAATFIKQAGHNYEPSYGGFSQEPKFPHTSTLTTLLNIYRLEGDESVRDILTHTLDNMEAGGIYDLVEGGFYRYSVDMEWLVPHFEKMTYDNGLLCELYATAYLQLGEESYKKTSEEIADFMCGRMMENNLFYSASDADTDGVEGKYFVYTRKELLSAMESIGITGDEADKKCIRLSATPEGNFEESNVLRFLNTEREPWFEALKAPLLKMREERTYPFIDRKVQVSWNAMIIKALFILGNVDERYTQQARDSLKALSETMMIEGELYHSTLINRPPKVKAFLEDYAYLGTAFIEAYQQTFDESCLIQAQRLANTALERFYDNGRWFFSKGEFVTEADSSDSSYPGAIGVIVDLLLSLGMLVDEKYRHFAFKTLEYYSAKLMKTPIYFPYLCNQALRYTYGERLVKSNTKALHDNSLTLRRLSYPYTQCKPENAEEFMVCGSHSCFAATKDVTSINTLITRSL